MASFDVEVKRAEARGDKKANGWSGAIRQVENTGLEVGDVLTIPQDFTNRIYEQKFGDNKAEYVLCQLGDTDQVKAFFPSTFTKWRTVYEEDGRSTGVRKITGGTAAELFRTFGTVKDGMEALRGKKIKVTNIEQVRTLRYGTTELMTAQIPTVDLVN